MLNYSNIIIIACVTLPALGQVIYSPEGFFSHNDLTSVTWAHRVNSQQALNESLANPSIQMLEADVLKGRTNISGVISPIDIAIMSHPPATMSDLSFVDFINQVVKFNEGKPLQERKGVKLDFKDYFGAAMAILSLNETGIGNPLTFPVWLNADILKGPVDSTNDPKISGEQLFNLHKKNFPEAVLSLGWTTRYENKGSYTRIQIEEMIEVVKSYAPNEPEVVKNLPVTFALRAGLAANSLGNIMYLLNSTSERATVTLWAGEDDPPVVFDDFFKLVGKNKAFVDVPFDVKENSARNLGYDLAVMLFGCLIRYLVCQLSI